MDPFLEASGATGPLRWSIERRGVVEAEVSLDRPYALVGSDPASDLPLDDPSVCRRHAYLQAVAGQLFCIDLGSRLGTSLAGKSLRSAWVGPGQAIRVGPYRIRLLSGLGESAGGPGPEAPAPEVLPGSLLTLELSHRGLRPSLCQLDSAVALIGSAPDCQVRLLDPSVSNYHCGLLHLPQGVWLVDLLGEGGVSVNGEARRCARIDDGDEVRVGHSVIRLWRAAGLSPGGLPDPGAGALAVPLSVPGTPTVDEPASAGREDPGIWERLAGQTPEVAALVEAALAPMVEQLGQLQRSLSEQFQEAREALIREFAELRREQENTLEREIDRLRQAVGELEALSSRTGTSDAHAHAPEPTPPLRLGSAGRRGLARRSTAGSLALIPSVDPDSTSPLGPFAANGDGVDLPSSEGCSFEPDSDGGLPRHQDIHALLCQRIQAIQREHRSRWREIFDGIPGAPQAEPVP